MPVFSRNRIYVAGGGDVFWGKNEAWLKCIDPTRSGDIESNGLIWSYPLQKHVMSTPAIVNGLVFIADCGRAVHCLDADTGQPHWTEEINGEAWASPLVADGKVYLGTRSGSFYVFAASKEKKLLSTVELGDPISATATAANSVLSSYRVVTSGCFPDEAEAAARAKQLQSAGFAAAYARCACPRQACTS